MKFHSWQRCAIFSSYYKHIVRSDWDEICDDDDARKTNSQLMTVTNFNLVHIFLVLSLSLSETCLTLSDSEIVPQHARARWIRAESLRCEFDRHKSFIYLLIIKFFSFLLAWIMFIKSVSGIFEKFIRSCQSSTLTPHHRRRVFFSLKFQLSPRANGEGLN